MKKKTLAILLSCAMLMGATVGGAIAWLTDTTEEVVNTFTVGNIEIDLTESDWVEGDEHIEDNQNDYHFVPGDVLPKDPKVTVQAGSEACYLFVKVVEKENTFTNSDGKEESIINWHICNLDSDTTPIPSEEWVAYTPKTVVEGTTYYYRIIDEETAKGGTAFYLLTGDVANENGSVAVSPNVTKEMIDEINGTDGTADNPSLTFWAAAVQYDNIIADGEKTAVDVAFDQISWPVK